MNVFTQFGQRMDNVVESCIDTEASPWEQGAKLIDDCHSLFVEDIRGLELVIVLIEGNVQPLVESIIVGDQDMGAGYPIHADSTSRRFIVWFASHKIVRYMILNESYSEPPEALEEFSGRHFRVFSKSRLLDFVRVTSNGLVAINESITHYEIVCQNHIIDVIALGPPVIHLLSPETQS
jgi:hypothetical protein